MRAHKIYETQNFEQPGQGNPYIKMNIGVISEIKKLLDQYFDEGHYWIKYKIHNPNKIELYYPKNYINGLADNIKNNELKNGRFDSRYIKYIKIKKFAIDIKLLPANDKLCVIKEYIPNMRSITQYYFKGGFDTSGRNTFISTDEKEAQAVLKALNDYHGLIGGFEIIDI